MFGKLCRLGVVWLVLLCAFIWGLYLGLSVRDLGVMFIFVNIERPNGLVAFNVGHSNFGGKRCKP